AASSETSMVSAGELCFQVLSAAFTQAPRTASTPTTEAPVMPVEVSPAYPVMTFVFTGSQTPEELPCMRYAGLHSFVVLLKMQPPDAAASQSTCVVAAAHAACVAAETPTGPSKTNCAALSDIWQVVSPAGNALCSISFFENATRLFPL